MGNPYGAGSYEQMLTMLRMMQASGVVDDAKLEEMARAFVNDALRSNPDLGAHIPGSRHYRRKTRDEPPGASYQRTMDEAAREYGQYAHFGFDSSSGPDETVFTFRDFANEQAGFAREFGTRTPPQPQTPARRAAIDRIRALQRMVDSSTYEGERANAKAAIQRLRDKHGILSHEA